MWLPGLLWKLQKYGVKGKAWAWCKAFLQDREIRVVHSGQVSDWFKLLAGTPQGAVLSPFFFLIYIDDLIELALACGCDIALFADDIVAWAKQQGHRGDAALQDFLNALTNWAAEWKVTFGQKKSQVIQFSRSRSPPEIPKFSLTGFELDFTDSYKYLGVWFERDLSWTKQTLEMLARANRVSAVICSTIVPNQPPGFSCVNSLVNSLLVPVVSYGFPVWSVPPEFVARTDSILARPFRRLLSLPQKSTHSASVLIECGALTCESLLRLSALRFGFRLVASDIEDPCKRLLWVKTDAIAARINESSRWAGLPYDDAEQVRDARHRVELKQLLEWQASNVGVWQLKDLKLTTGPASYLRHDGRRLAAVRARLRLNRCSLNASLAERKVIPDAGCGVCAVPETVEHCLLVCPQFAALRQQCAAALDYLGLPLNIAIVLGADGVSPASKQRSALVATGHFLLAIDNARRL